MSRLRNVEVIYMKYVVLFFTMLALGCTGPLDTVMQSDHPLIRKVSDQIDSYEIQIIYTQIDSTAEGEVKFTDHSFQLDNDRYFYPASTVKLPLALLTAEYVDNHKELSLDIPYVTTRDTLTHTISKDIAAIFAVSDNESYNRLYEILGRDYVNTLLSEKGLAPARISHRLSTSQADQPLRATTKFYPNYSAETVVIENKIDDVIKTLKLTGIKKGSGVYRNDSLYYTPMDFSLKNYFPLETQHNVMKRLIFPEKFPKNERFNLSKKTRQRFLNLMQVVPRTAGYTSEEYYDSYVKFFLVGDTKEAIPNHIKIYNKVGYAYGTLTETAYIVDRKENISFLLSATILVNENGIFNDDVYEYEDVGIPFLAQLGREVYQIEKDRKRLK